MRSYFFIIVVALGLLLAGCVKTEVQGDSGVHLGFIEENSSLPENVEPELPLPAEPLPLAPEPIPEPDVLPEPIIEPDSPPAADPAPQVLVEANTTNNTNSTNATLVNESNTTLPELIPPIPADPDNPLGFPIRIDSNKYYQDGAIPCHNSGLTQCVHIYVGQNDCGTDCRLDPEAIMVPIGTTVEWGNHDSAQHSITAQDGRFASGPLDPLIHSDGIYPNYFSSHFTYTFNSPGEYNYRGEEGSTLNGAVIVVSSLS